MRKRVQRSREKALGALGAKGYLVAGGFAALLAGMVALYIGRSPDADVVTNPPTPGEQAERERRDAADACRVQRWDACERALDRAAQLDPEGDRAEPVRVLRAAIAAGRRGAVSHEGGDVPP